jgi:hypothetical protein
MRRKFVDVSLFVVVGMSLCSVAFGQTLFDDFDTDPIGTRFTVSGSTTSENALGQTVPTFSYQGGSVIVNYNSSQPWARLARPLPMTVEETDRFRFGATFTILSDGLVVNDTESFFQFATFALVNSSLTGQSRDTGDTYSTVEFDYFPQDSPFWDTLSLGPAVITGKTAQDDFSSRMFFDYGPNTTLVDEVNAGLLPARGLPFDTPLLAYIEYDGRTDPSHPRVELKVSIVTDSGLDVLPTGVPVFDLSTFANFATHFDGFSCDTFGLINYQEQAWIPSSPSHIGTVVFDSIFFEVDDPAGDPDGDGLSNEMEELLGTDPNDPDTDDDGSNDGDDAFPLNPHGQTNADGDNLGDEFELLIVAAYPAYSAIEDVGPDDDPDGDDVTNLVEFQWGTDPTDPTSHVPLGAVVTAVSTGIFLSIGVLVLRRPARGCRKGRPVV